jgi:hypothetical protein
MALTPVKAAKAVELWAAGKTAVQIATELGGLSHLADKGKATVMRALKKLGAHKSDDKAHAPRTKGVSTKKSTAVQRPPRGKGIPRDQVPAFIASVPDVPPITVTDEEVMAGWLAEITALDKKPLSALLAEDDAPKPRWVPKCNAYDERRGTKCSEDRDGNNAYCRVHRGWSRTGFTLTHWQTSSM